MSARDEGRAWAEQAWAMCSRGWEPYRQRTFQDAIVGGGFLLDDKHRAPDVIAAAGERWRELQSPHGDRAADDAPDPTFALTPAREEHGTLDEALATPWPLGDVLQRLLDAAKHLRDDHDCDQHGHEELSAAIEAGEKLRAALRQHATPPVAASPTVIKQYRGVLRGDQVTILDANGIGLTTGYGTADGEPVTITVTRGGAPTGHDVHKGDR